MNISYVASKKITTRRTSTSPTAAKISGQSGALGDANGRLVLSGAGLLATDLATGALLTQTPNVKDSRQILCSTLGGAAAPVR